uniref:eIF-4F 25 kDa subunit n=1 Tax=Meloidogyne javanica TaxID=6303 RepID=A0A915NAD3_MELJA
MGNSEIINMLCNMIVQLRALHTEKYNEISASVLTDFRRSIQDAMNKSTHHSSRWSTAPGHRFNTYNERKNRIGAGNNVPMLRNRASVMILILESLISTMKKITDGEYNGIKGKDLNALRTEPSNPLHSDEHALEHSYIFSYFMRPQEKFDPEDYAIFVQPVARISSVEQFWLIYRFIKRPSDLTEKVDFHLFKEGIKPVWEDPANRNGGKWILRLKKGLSSRIWENLLLAMIGEQFLVGGEVVGAVCSVRNQEDIISLWNRSSDSAPVTNRIRETLRRVLNLPSNAILEYKRHGL